MGPKKNVNTKAEEARSRKESVAVAKASQKRQEDEDSAWQDEGQKSKASKKKEEDEKRRTEAALKKLEAKKLAEEEEKEMAKISKKGGGEASSSKGGGGGGKVTVAELAKMKEKEAKARAKEAEDAKKKEKRVVGEEEYEAMVGIENRNRVEEVVDARSVAEAFDQLVVGDKGKGPVDMHPEKRMKAAYKAYEEAELASLRAERPGMTLTQYKDLIWKSWKKSPLNPLNQDK